MSDNTLLDEALANLTPERIERNQRAYASIVAKYYSDPDFKAEVDADPTRVLKAEGLEIPEGAKVKLLFNTESLLHIVLPGPSKANPDDGLAIHRRLSMCKMHTTLRISPEVPAKAEMGESLRRAKVAGLSGPLPEGMDERALEARLFPGVSGILSFPMPNNFRNLLIHEYLATV